MCSPSTLRTTHYITLCLFLFAIYLLTYTPRINSSDGLAMFATAESLVRRGALDIEQIRWMGLQQGTYGLDGLLYSRKGIGVPLGLLPLTGLGLLLPGIGPVGTSLLFNALVTALTGGLLLAYLTALGFRPQTGLIVALTFGLTTLAWPYAKSLFSDPFSALLLLAAAYFLLKMNQAVESASQDSENIVSASLRLRASTWLWSALAGLCLGWNVATRYAELLFLPLFGLLFLYYLYQKFNRHHFLRPTSDASHIRHHVLRFTFYVLRTHRPTLTAFLSPILLTGLALFIFNLTRYGDPLNTGYLPNETFSGILWQGVLGQLLSPGRGLLLYCPVFFLSLLGLSPFLRRHPAEALTALGIILIHLLLYGKWFMWHGGYAWGPRFMIPTLPFWAIFLAPIVATAFPPQSSTPTSSSATPTQSPDPSIPQSPNPPISQSPNPPISNPPISQSLLRPLFLLLALLGLIPQLLTVSIHFTPFLDSLLDTGLPLFAPATFFEWQYSPLVAAWSFIRPETLDVAWAWQGEINGWLVGLLLLNIVVCGGVLWWAAGRCCSKPPRPPGGGSDEPNSPRPPGGGSDEPNSSRLPGGGSDEPNSSRLPGGGSDEPNSSRLPGGGSDEPNSSRLPGGGSDEPNPPLWGARGASSGLPLLSTLIALIALLTHVHGLPPEPLAQTVASLNRAVQPTDAIITNDPALTTDFAELYAGRAPVLGLNHGGTLPADIEQRLRQIIAGHEQVWWLPNWLPPDQSGVEQLLLAEGFQARAETFGQQRLLLFVFPPALVEQPLPAATTFADAIRLEAVALPPQVNRGQALPVELTWQGLIPLTEDYHVFLHLIDAQGQVVAQADGQPAHWTRPTSTWVVGERIEDRHGLWLPADLSPGPYKLLIGLYQPAEGQRLRLPDGADGVGLEIEVR